MENDENFKSWASQPDVCRCCLSTSGTWDLLAAYVTEAGEQEIYSEILLDCFGTSLSLLSEWGGGRLACDACVAQIRNAHAFKKQVQRAEEHFVIFFNSRHETIQETIKLRVEETKSSLEPGNEETEDAIPDKNTLTDNDGVDWHSDNEVTKVNDNKFLTTTSNKDNCTEENVGLPSEIGHDEYRPNEDVNTADVTSKVLEIRPPDGKQVSERRRIKLTCDTVLRDTTACPFRHHNSWFRCFFCTQSFMDIPDLRKHTTLKHTNIEQQIMQLKRYPRSLQIDITELRCRRCNLNLRDVDTMKIHFQNAHDQVIYKECIADYKVNGIPYTCHLCDKQFHVFRTLTTHLNEHYANYICAVCGKSFLNSKRLEVHSRTHKEGTFPCLECGKVLKTKSSQANHLETHSNRVLRCQICSKPMKHYNERIKHMSEEHKITHTFKCPICPREYNIKHYLATHIRQTHGHKNNKCAECGSAFATNHSLKKHMLRHSGVKAFSCVICSKAYARNYTLREHMRLHE